jgi:elongation factor P
MLKASNLKKGNVVEINGQPYQTKHIETKSPSARGANTLYKVRYANLLSGQKLEQTYKGNDALEEMELERRPASYLYNDASGYTFMDLENYEQYTLTVESLENQIPWLVDGMEGITAFLLNGHVVAIELPSTIDMAIVETEPVVKGATATNRNKPAILENGETVMVPEYLSEGEVIKVNLETGKYMSRAKS